MPQNTEDNNRVEVRENKTQERETQENRENNNVKAGLGPWILGSAAILAIPLLLCCFPRGCKRGCDDCDKPVVEPKKEIVVVKDTVVVEQYNVGGDMVNVKGNNNDVNFTKGNGNNVSSRNSGTQTWERAVRPQPKPVKKKPVIKPEPEPKPEPVVEPKPEPKPEPEVVKKHCTVVITYQTPCNQNCR